MCVFLYRDRVPPCQSCNMDVSCAVCATDGGMMQDEISRAQRLATAIHDVTGRRKYPHPLLLAAAAGIVLAAGPGTCSLHDRALYLESADRREQGELMTRALAGSIMLRHRIRYTHDAASVLVAELLVPAWIFELGSLRDTLEHHVWAPRSLIAARWIPQDESSSGVA